MMTSDKPLFSIVTVTLNAGKALLDTVDSVTRQNFQDYEYIIKDGGSSDGSLETIPKTSPIQIVRRDDEGIYDAMNQALELCRGQFVYFLNADDTLYSPDVLGQVASVLDDDAAVIYGNIFLMPMELTRHHPPRLTRFYLFRKNLNHQAWMARREVYQLFGGFDLRYRFNADQYFLRRVVLNHQMPAQHVDMVWARWSYGGFSTCQSNRELVRRERWQMLQEFYSPLEICVYGVASFYFLNRLKVRIWGLWWQWRRVRERGND